MKIIDLVKVAVGRFSMKENDHLILLFLAGMLLACGGEDSKKITVLKVYDPQPICDAGDTVSCNSLAGIWGSGTATCASDRFSYDVSSCVRKPREDLGSGRVSEVVYPAQRDDRWKDAKCNYDGDFVFEISYPQNPDGTWLIELEGGGFCAFDGSMGGDGDGSCSLREEYKVRPIRSTPGNPPFGDDRTTGDTGLDVEPEFENAIQVKANYCSSDLWSGTNTEGIMVHYETDAEGATYKKWPFTGHINFSSMIDILQERYGLQDSNENLQIHYRGQSAGGWGVINNAYEMKARFPKISARGKLMMSSWEGFIPQYWDDPRFPVFGITDPEYLTEAAAFKMVIDNWKSSLYPTCTAMHVNDPQSCLFGNIMYDYITGSEAIGGMDIPLFIFQNRQDQLYMNLLQLPYQMSTNTSDEKEGRTKFITMMNDIMGISPNVPNASNKIKWLYAPSDPAVDEEQSRAEPNVHPPLCYEADSPEGANKSVNAMTSRFWATRGQGPGRGKQAGEVITWDVNFVTIDSICD